MQLGSTLIAISNDARGWLKAWAGDFTDAEAVENHGAPANPLVWQLGHLAVTEDFVSGLFGGKTGVTTKELQAICGSGCPTPTRDTRYASLTDLWTMLERTHANLLAVAEQASDADFERQPNQDNPFFKTLGQALYEAALHENYHVGEIGTLRKALRKKRIG